MKRYFLYQLKSNSRAIIIVTVLMMIISFFFSMETMSREHTPKYAFDGENTYFVNSYSYGTPDSYVNYYGERIKITNEAILTRSYRDLSLSCPVGILLSLSVIIPAWAFGFMKKKRNLDCYYSLPITKRGLGTAHYLLGLFAMYIPFLFSYAVMLIYNASYGLFGNIAHEYLILHFGVCLLAGFVIYSISCFAFDRANTVIDGIIMIAIYLFVIFLFAICIRTILNDIFLLVHRIRIHAHIKIEYDSIEWLERHLIILNEENGIPFVPFVELLSSLESDAELIYTGYTNRFLEGDGNIAWLIFWCIVGTLSAIGLIYGFGKKKAELAEEISSSIFCYKLLIPTVCILYNIHYGIFNNDTTSCLVTTIACIIAYTVYRRGIRYKVSDYIVMGVMLLLTVCSLFVYYTIMIP